MTGHDKDQTPDIIHATPRGRLLSTALLALAALLVGLFSLIALPFIDANLGTAPTADGIAGLKHLLIGFTALAILPALALIAVGRKIAGSGQSPPPGAWVWRDTPVRRGHAARRIGWLCILSGALAGLLCVAVVATIWMMFDRLVPQPAPQSGTIILKQIITVEP